MKRRFVFAAIALVGIAAVAIGIARGDLVTIHRFAAQI